MKAAVIHEHGGLDCVKIEQVPEPKAGAGEVVLEVRSAALNHLDIWVRKGRPGLELKMPHVLGSDAAGVVVELGSGTHGVSIGDEVVLNPGLSCGRCESCLRGRQSECLSFSIVGAGRPGTFAEKVAVPACNVFPKPPHLNFDEAAALPLAYQTAWRMLMARAALKPGETVLIHGIGGGVALAALQLAKLAGAEVIVTSSSDEKLSRAAGLGADHSVNYKSVDNVAETVKDITAGRGVDVVIDAVGAGTWEANFNLVRRGGRIVLCGITTGGRAQTNLQALYWNQLTIMGSTMGSHEDVRLMLRAVTAAGLRPVIDSVRPLDDAREAMSRMEAGEQSGKIVLRISE
ncbi:MAG: zinc-binding dehydrogenase [Phycisphaerales bacterium]|nr:MAG: zinc-binding dehydrogenase [Phycisphaerales bacterium]